jgi:hypothetical protein
MLTPTRRQVGGVALSLKNGLFLRLRLDHQVCNQSTSEWTIVRIHCDFRRITVTIR